MENLKSRYVKEAIYLLKADYPVSIEEIGKSIGVKSRTLKNDLKLISDFFSSRGVLLVRKPGTGVYVKAEKSSDKEKLKEELINLFKNTNPDKDERFKIILLDCLSKDKIPTIEDWCFQFNVSRPTILKNVSHVKNWLKNKGLFLKGKSGRGYILEGREEDIRDAMVDLILDEGEEVEDNVDRGNISSKLKEKLFKNINLSVLETFLNEIEKITKAAIVDRDFSVLAFKLAISIDRLKNGHIISMEPKKVFNIMQNPVYQVIFDNINTIEESYKVKLPLEEVAYITLSFIGSKIKDSFGINSFSISDKKYSEFAKNIVRISEDILGLPIGHDDEFIRMLSLHLKTMLTKIKYGIKVENPLLEEIKREYPLSFSIAKRVSLILGRTMHLKIPEEEAGYIAMYIAVASEKLRHERVKRKKVAVICSMAVGTSNLLFWRIMNEMPEIDVVQVGSYKDIVDGKIKPNLDLVISTIPLPNIGVPYVIVSPFLNPDERKEIREKLGISKRAKIPFFSSVENSLDEELIFTDLNARDYKEVISIMGDKLVEKGYVKDGFVEATIEREKEFPTGLNTLIPFALPHADPEFTIKEGFAIAILKDEVGFKDMGDLKSVLNVRVVLIPVLLPKSLLNTVFYQLVEGMRSIKIMQRLLLAKNPKEVKDILIKYLST